MVIQRWQSLILLIAVVVMSLFCFTPWAQVVTTDTVTPLYVTDTPVFLTLNLLIAALLFISIFMYKNLRQQMRVVQLTILLISASIVTGAAILFVGRPEAEQIFAGGTSLLVVALILAIAAYRFMRRDRRILSSYDRLR